MAKSIRATIKCARLLSNEHQLRSAVKSTLLDEYKYDPATRIVDELGLRHGAARVDVAVVNGIIHGFELKSDSDNLKRLPSQVQIYSSVLDKITLVVGPRHAPAATALVPWWWGITIATITDRRDFMFEIQRAGQQNPSLDVLSVCKLLWRDEALSLLEEIGEATCVRYSRRALVYAHLARMAEPEFIKARVRRQLKAREGWRPVSLPVLGDD